MARPLRELDVPPSALQNVRIMGELSKRSSAWPRGWGKRHCILSGNLLYVFASPAATQAVRVILVDGATLTVRLGFVCVCEHRPLSGHCCTHLLSFVDWLHPHSGALLFPHATLSLSTFPDHPLLAA